MNDHSIAEHAQPITRGDACIPTSEAKPDALAQDLYDEAWRRWGDQCLWSVRRSDNPTVADLRTVARALRARGNVDAWALADRIREMVGAT